MFVADITRWCLIGKEESYRGTDFFSPDVANATGSSCDTRRARMASSNSHFTKLGSWHNLPVRAAGEGRSVLCINRRPWWQQCNDSTRLLSDEAKYNHIKSASGFLTPLRWIFFCDRGLWSCQNVELDSAFCARYQRQDWTLQYSSPD